MSHAPYTNAVGGLIYVMVCMRPVLSQAVSKVTRYMHDLSKGSLGDRKWIQSYIKGTIDIELVFEKDTNDK